MSGQDETSDIEIVKGKGIIDLITTHDTETPNAIIDSIIGAHATLQTSTIKIPKLESGKPDYEKYYVPKVVSIGPHHFGASKLDFVEKLKPVYTMKLLSGDKAAVVSLYNTLAKPEMVKSLRSFYEQDSTGRFSDEDFTKMMLLDSCFILYYILRISDFDEKQPENFQELTSQQIACVHQDLFLFENQIPFKVLAEVMKSVSNIHIDNSKIGTFIYSNILAPGKSKEKRQDVRDTRIWDNGPVHLLQLLHRAHTNNAKIFKNDSNPNYSKYKSNSFPNVNQLVDVGIHFKASNTMSWADIKFSDHWWGFTKNVELPPITMDDYTKPLLLNLIAYEMSSDAIEWVTSYVCLLQDLLAHHEDVMVLRNAGVVENLLGTDKEVAELLDEIGTGLVPNNFAYLEAKNEIQRHYERWSNTLMSQLVHEYHKSPWKFLSLLGALIALFLSGVQTYFTVWSLKGTCDDLCLFLKMNHRL